MNIRLQVNYTFVFAMSKFYRVIFTIMALIIQGTHTHTKKKPHSQKTTIWQWNKQTVQEMDKVEYRLKSLKWKTIFIISL